MSCPECAANIKAAVEAMHENDLVQKELDSLEEKYRALEIDLHITQENADAFLDDVIAHEREIKSLRETLVWAITYWREDLQRAYRGEEELLKEVERLRNNWEDIQEKKKDV